ncbi:AraC family transcriptional regulator [Oscillospiraceae bacterium PP1C4]
MKWLKKLSDAIDYIEDHLDKDISYDEAAKIACCSIYYFQRMFSYVAGISLSEYIRRRRMTQAAFVLQSTDVKVLDVALRYGYNSPTSFNRAFQSIHGISPVGARNSGNVLNAYLPIKFSVQVTGGSSMSYRIKEKEAMRIVGIRIPITEDMEKNQKNVPTFWNSTVQSDQYYQICGLSNKAPDGILGITVYQSPKEIYYYICAASDRPAPAGMFEYEIPAATWVIFESDGHFKETVQSTFRRFLTEWLPFSRYIYAELPDIEVYPINPNIPQSGHSEVWIAIKKEKEN